MAERQGNDLVTPMTLISVGVPTEDLETLRLVAAGTGGSVAHLIRSGIQCKLAELRNDRSFVDKLEARRGMLHQHVADLE